MNVTSFRKMGVGVAVERKANSTSQAAVPQSEQRPAGPAALSAWGPGLEQDRHTGQTLSGGHLWEAGARRSEWCERWSSARGQGSSPAGCVSAAWVPHVIPDQEPSYWLCSRARAFSGGKSPSFKTPAMAPPGSSCRSHAQGLALQRAIEA